jgi:long-chain acyl-CoA synthetase
VLSDYSQPLYSLLDNAAQIYPKHTFTIYQGKERSYVQVNQTSNKVAGFLKSIGLEKGDRVAIFLPNVPQFPEIFFGILKAGAVCVTCNPLYTADELNYQLKDCKAKVAFCMDHPLFYPTTVQAVKNTDVHTVVICNVKSYLPGFKALFGGLLGKIPKADVHEREHLLFDDVIKNAVAIEQPVKVNPTEDVALMLYTSGTTGKPKGACLTHANMMFGAHSMNTWVHFVQTSGGEAEVLKCGGAHCFLGLLPWYHVFGLWTSMFWSCLTGNKLVCHPDPRSGNPPFSEALESVQRYKVTFIALVPSLFAAISNHPQIDKYDLRSLISCASGAAPLASETMARFEKKTGAVIFEGYGMSECIPISINPTNLEERKIGSVGMPPPGVSVKIVDIDTGLKELPLGEEGEIAVSGPQLMKGYFNMPEADKESFRAIGGKRYFLTGDIGRIGSNGFLTITDRKKDLILVGGFNVYPAEVEEAIISHPKVSLAAVIGIPDEERNEKVKAFIMLRPGEIATVEEIMEHCQKKLAGYKRPREIEFREALPTSIVGKVIRRVLKEENKAQQKK